MNEDLLRRDALKLKTILTHRYLRGSGSWVPERNMKRSIRWKGRSIPRTLYRKDFHNPRKNIVGIGVGRKISKENVSTEWCIVFFVTRKFSESSIAKRHLIPKCYDGIPTDIVEVGIPTPCLFPGGSIGCIRGDGQAEAGTFGAIVTDGRDDFCLSNSHVIADEGRKSVGSEVHVPSLKDSSITSIVAQLHRFGNLSSGSLRRRLDCAIAKLPRSSGYNNTFPAPIGTVSRSSYPKVGDTVYKMGRTTGITEGVIVHEYTSEYFNYDHFGKTFLSNLFTIESVSTGKDFAMGGDSGALIVDKFNKRALGIIVGTGSNKMCFAHPIDAVLDELDVVLS